MTFAHPTNLISLAMFACAASFSPQAAAADFDVVATSSGGDSNLSLSAALTTASAHVGQKGEVYVAARLKDVWYFNNKTGWLTQMSPYQSGPLAAGMNIPVTSGMNLSSLPGLELYVGYGLNLTDMLSASRYKLLYTVSGGTAYLQGELYGKDAFFTQASNATAKTTGALMQAVLAVNSVLYTDPAVSDISTFRERKAAADKALATLQTYVQETETVLAQGTTASLDENAQPENAFATLNPEDVLATVAAGSSKTQLKTLMAKYGVGAKEAKTILDNAMSGLISDYDKTANFYNNAARTAQLVKEGSGLALTVVGSVATAGGVTGALALGEAAVTLITGVDGAIKVTKAGLELIKGADIPQPGGTAGAVLTTLSDASEIIAFTSLKKWTDPGDKLSNVVNIVMKTNDALQDGELNLGAHTFSLKPLARPLPAEVTSKLNPPQGTIPSTMTGKYKIAGGTVEVTKLPDAVKDVIAMLPETERLPDVVNKVPASGVTTLDTLNIALDLTAQLTTSCVSTYGHNTHSYQLYSNAKAPTGTYGSILAGSSDTTFTINNNKILCSGGFSGSSITMSCRNSSYKFSVTIPVNVGSKTVSVSDGEYTGYTADGQSPYTCKVGVSGNVTADAVAH